MSAEADRPSARAAARLAEGVGAEVADLRTQLREALEQAEQLEADGRQDLAVVVLEEQRAVLHTIHRRLEERLADAAVEREAERVVAGVAPEPAAPDGMGLRLLASAAAALLGVLLLLSPELGGGGLTAAGSPAADDPPATDGTPGVDTGGPVARTSTGLPPGRWSPAPLGSTVDLVALGLPEADRRVAGGDGGDTDDGDLPVDVPDLARLPSEVAPLGEVAPELDALPTDDPGTADDDGDGGDPGEGDDAGTTGDGGAATDGDGTTDGQGSDGADQGDGSSAPDDGTDGTASDDTDGPASGDDGDGGGPRTEDPVRVGGGSVGFGG